MVIKFILLIIGAYLLGSVPAAYVIARWRRGIDIRKYGSGNVGAANVLAAVSRWWSIPVTLFDIGKGAFAVWLAQLLGLGAAQQVTVGIFAIIGHNWPVFLQFKGGRGVFTSLGVITMLSPKLGLIILVMPYLLAPIRQVSLGVFIALLSLPFFSWFLSQPLDIEERLPITLGLITLALMGLSKRLMASRTALSQSVPTAKLMVTRMLFDRDIWDRKAWINQPRPELNSAEKPAETDEKPLDG